MSERLILGVDEGTTGVKAALFDERLRPVREARRDKLTRYPRPGWVEQDGEEVLSAVVEAVAEVLEDAPGEVTACGLDHQGESVLAWDAESGAPVSASQARTDSPWWSRPQATTSPGASWSSSATASSFSSSQASFPAEKYGSSGMPLRVRTSSACPSFSSRSRTSCERLSCQTTIGLNGLPLSASQASTDSPW